MTFHEELVERALAIHQRNGQNPQSILDNRYFKDLTLEEKRDFIERHRDYLRGDPQFNWRDVAIGGAGASAFAGLGTMLHQISTSASRGVGIHPVPVVAALGAGALIGTVLNIAKSRSDYNRDKQTQRNIDDVVNTIVLRGMSSPAVRTDVATKLELEVEKAPLLYGQTLSSADWDAIHRRDAENYANRRAQEQGE